MLYYALVIGAFPRGLLDRTCNDHSRSSDLNGTLDWPSGRVTQLPLPDGRHIVYGVPYQPGRAAGVLSASRVHASLRSDFAVRTGPVENGAIQGVPYEHPDNSAFAGYRRAALANHQTEVRLRTEASC
jgi:hypothetical protein